MEAARCQRQRDTWEDRPYVKAARREEAGNRMMVAAVKTDDSKTEAALAQEDGLSIAREVLFRREAER